MADVQDKSDAYAAIDQGEVDAYLAGVLGTGPSSCDCAQ